METELTNVLEKIENMDLNVVKIISDYVKWPYVYKEKDLCIIHISSYSEEHRIAYDEPTEQINIYYDYNTKQYLVGYNGYCRNDACFKDNKPYWKKKENEEMNEQYFPRDKTIFIQSEFNETFDTYRVNKIKSYTKEQVENLLEDEFRKLRLKYQCKYISNFYFRIGMEEMATFGEDEDILPDKELRNFFKDTWKAIHDVYINGEKIFE